MKKWKGNGVHEAGYIYIYMRHLHCIVFHRGLQRVIYPNRDIFLSPPLPSFFFFHWKGKINYILSLPPLAFANIYRVNSDIYRL